MTLPFTPAPYRSGDWQSNRFMVRRQILHNPNIFLTLDSPSFFSRSGIRLPITCRSQIGAAFGQQRPDLVCVIFHFVIVVDAESHPRTSPGERIIKAGAVTRDLVNVADDRNVGVGLRQLASSATSTSLTTIVRFVPALILIFFVIGQLGHFQLLSLIQLVLTPEPQIVKVNGIEPDLRVGWCSLSRSTC